MKLLFLISFIVFVLFSFFLSMIYLDTDWVDVDQNSDVVQHECLALFERASHISLE